LANATKLRIKHVDITTLDVDAIVNAANQTLLGGRGVDGAIHEAAGEELLAYCKLLGGCKTGEAKLSPGFNLKARYVIHTVGPVWEGGQNGEAILLANCYRNCLAIARKERFVSVAFPAISTGAFGYPMEAATRIAISTVREFLEQNEHELREIVFACFSPKAMLLYERIHDDVYSH
jgi:O-acetyl-ADP-ribose deacetylase (regulator of RNase III)